MKQRRRPIHLWVPELAEGSGGIQAFSRVYVQALAQAFPDRHLRVLIKSDLPAAGDALRALGVRFHSVAALPAALRAPALAAVGIVAGLKESPAVAITTHLNFLPALQWLHRLNGTPTASVLHGVEAWDIHHPARVNALRQADHLLAVSHHTRAVVSSTHDIPPDRITVVPNTFDVDRFAIGPKPPYLLTRYGLQANQPVLLTVSRLSESEAYKGHRQVIEAIQVIRRRHPEVHYLIAGDGDDRPELEQLVVDHGLRKHVTFAGRIPASELADHYRLCDCFVMPSSREGFGIVFMEAMASGKPVIAGNADGSVDALDGGRLGSLVDPKNSQEIAEAVCRILEGKHGNDLFNQPEKLRAEVVKLFGYDRVSRLMAEDIRPLIERSTN